MAGKGNAKGMLAVIGELLTVQPWGRYFNNMAFPYDFFSAEEYKAFLVSWRSAKACGAFSKAMKHKGG